MASLGHVAVGMAAGRLWSGRGVTRAMLAFSALSLAPDLDVIAFRVGVPYAAPFGHRGAAHSICAALVLAAIAALATRVSAGRSRAHLWLLCAAVAVSHGLLDALTDGGLGIALLWPFSKQRFFAPWTPIPVAPIGVRMLTRRALHVVGVEALQFAPLLLWAVWPRRLQGGSPAR